MTLAGSTETWGGLWQVDGDVGVTLAGRRRRGGDSGRSTETWSDSGRSTETWSDSGRSTETWSDSGRSTETWSDSGRSTEDVE